MSQIINKRLKLYEFFVWLQRFGIFQEFLEEKRKYYKVPCVELVPRIMLITTPNFFFEHKYGLIHNFRAEIVSFHFTDTDNPAMWYNIALKIEGYFFILEKGEQP